MTLERVTCKQSTIEPPLGYSQTTGSRRWACVCFQHSLVRSSCSCRSRHFSWRQNAAINVDALRRKERLCDFCFGGHVPFGDSFDANTRNATNFKSQVCGIGISRIGFLAHENRRPLCRMLPYKALPSTKLGRLFKALARLTKYQAPFLSLPFRRRHIFLHWPDFAFRVTSSMFPATVAKRTHERHLEKNPRQRHLCETQIKPTRAPTG